MIVVEVLSGVLLVAGALFMLSGAVGLLRFPDFYTRIHAVGVTDSVGAGLVLLGLLLRTTAWDTGVRLVIILLFMALTSPTATHILAHAARRDGVRVWREGDPRR
ncbi:monovalent cation/H(+) antiporter subunit G [Streptomyces sp. TRM68367]|uniref:monovalent cation/H(+) antiporter subunit G n=1 Tax=Streptomyces sp. TRM68367 TaxID=2758415 RepID=UPI00165B0AD6|nr:monovalent cation/H(+) antiporter subunit G [Streptomyces sp. TRM68367]MBC9726332.1 monovalent cation/H(+) antiporter subunit G [Streptomyces sp. TRM68367]